MNHAFGRNIGSQDVVNEFLRFFAENGHLKIDGHSLKPKNDPSLLFINSGMAPMKPYFLGQQKPPSPQLCNVQRCLRTNDIEEVGDRHHLTFFEMMGSWSIGDYWKEHAIALAWQLLTGPFGFPPEKLYASVYAGDPELGIPADEDSIGIWQRVGMDPDHIVRLGKDNFWGPAGEYGPCGPCTEVFFDTGAQYGEAYRPGGHFDDVNRYIEIWNAGVFMEYNKLPTGMSPLAMRSVDTGSGLERMVMTLNGTETVYDTDLLQPLVQFTAAGLGLEPSHRAVRLISDHVRASVMLLADRVKPAPSGPGYIPRRLIRRAVAAAYQHSEAFDFTALVEIAIGNAGSWNPQVAEGRERIHAGFAREREEFEATLATGMTKLADAYAATGGAADGEAAFRLFSTYGLPVDTVREYFLSRGGSFDEAGFQAAFEDHQALSRNLKAKGEAAPAGAALEDLPQTEFVGYGALDAEATVLAILREGAAVEEAEEGEEALVVFDRTPFYGESGGQVGDQGTAEAAEGLFRVSDTVKPRPGVFAHRGTVERGALRVGDRASLSVDRPRRERIRSNHTATHLLHAALRSVLGKDVGQRGSRVDDERLRFDFTYGEKIPDAKLAEIEALANEHILANLALDTREMGFDEAVEAGALAFFEDKYGDRVRTVRFGDVSMELCGGTHAPATGDIGLLVIVSEGSVSRGVRRIQALTGRRAFAWLRERDRLLNRVSARLNARPEEVEDKVSALLDRSRAEAAAPPPADVSAAALAEGAGALADGTPLAVASVRVAPKALKPLALEVAERLKGVAVLAMEDGGSTAVAVAVHESRTAAWQAGAILGRLLPVVDGRGGGKATLASGAGAKPGSLPALLDAARGMREGAEAA